MRLFTTVAVVTTGLWLGLGSATAAHAAPQPAAGAPAAAEPSAQDQAAAKKEFVRGKADFAAKKFAEALAAFQESYRLVQSPNSHLWIVYSLTELGRLSDAYAEADALLIEAEDAAAKNPKYAATAQAAKDEQKRVRSKIGLLTVNVDTSALDPADAAQLTLTVGGQSIAQDRWTQPIPVAPGPVEVVLTGPSGSATEKTELAAGAEGSLAIAPPKPEAATPTPVGPVEGEEEEADSGPVDLMLPAIVAGGIGVAGLACFGIFGGLTLSEHSSLDEACPNGSCPPSRSSEADTGRTYQTVANISLVVGIVGVAAGATLLVIDLTQGDSSAAETEAAPTEPAPPEPAASVAFGPGSLLVQGTF